MSAFGRTVMLGQRLMLSRELRDDSPGQNLPQFDSERNSRASAISWMPVPELQTPLRENESL